VTKKAEFNAEEWATVVEGPLLSGLRVVASHRGGTIRESVAMSKVYAHARERHGESELLDELVASPPAIGPGQVQSRDQVAPLAEERLRSALAILESKATPDEIEAYKGFVTAVADAAARAHKEGGFIGIGGKEISPEEQEALDAISAVLRP
jgi:hypothetical protein